MVCRRGASPWNCRNMYVLQGIHGSQSVTLPPRGISSITVVPRISVMVYSSFESRGEIKRRRIWLLLYHS